MRLGRAVAPLLAAPVADDLGFTALPGPYDRLIGEVDGRAVFDAGLLPGDPVWAEVPMSAPDRWSPRELVHAADFDADGVVLQVRGHTGGDLDWYSADAVAGPPAAPLAATREVMPGRLDYPGAPHPRWWQIEDRAVDIGGFAPDRSYLATMLLLDVVLAHPDDWFSFPVAAPADAATQPSSGVLVRLGEAQVRDNFGQVWPLRQPSADGPDGWSLFRTAGLPEADLVVWPVAVAPHAGPVLDEVLLGVDEDANLAWAVELRTDGVALLPEAGTAAAVGETTRTGTRSFRYLPSTTLPDHWHAYQRVRAGDPRADGSAGDGRSGPWRQAVVADLSAPEPVPRPGPAARLVGGPSGTRLGRGHELAAWALPSSGVRLQAAGPAGAGHRRASRAVGRAQRTAAHRTADLGPALRRAGGGAAALASQGVPTRGCRRRRRARRSGPGARGPRRAAGPVRWRGPARRSRGGGRRPAACRPPGSIESSSWRRSFLPVQAARTWPVGSSVANS